MIKVCSFHHVVFTRGSSENSNKPKQKEFLTFHEIRAVWTTLTGELVLVIIPPALYLLLWFSSPVFPFIQLAKSSPHFYHVLLLLCIWPVVAGYLRTNFEAVSVLKVVSKPWIIHASLGYGKLLSRRLQTKHLFCHLHPCNFKIISWV